MKSVTTSLGAVAIASEEVAVMRRVMLQRARVLAVAMMLAACGSEPSPASGRVGADTTSSATGTGTDATAPVVGSAPPGVTIGPAVDADRSWSTRTIAVADEILEISTDGGQLLVSRSADGGVSWTAPIATELGLDWVGPAVTNGQEVFVSSGSGSSESSPPAVSVSADGGSTWTTSTLPVPSLSDSPYVIVDTNVSALAATDTVALALGSVLMRVDWQRYSIEVLGEDHGRVTGDGGWEEQWDITFEDGYTVSVDPSAIGLAEVVNSGLIAVAWVRTGSEWEAVDLPFVNAASDTTELVVGPSGLVLLSPPAEPLVAVDGGSSSPATDRNAGVVLLSTLLYHSTDGRTWRASEPPDGLADGEGALIGGPLGYVIVGETAMWFSTDGTTWSGVAEYEDTAPEMMGFLSAHRPAGGPAGFAAAFGDIDFVALGAPSGAARVLVSSDGRTWEPVPLPTGTIDAMVAVGPDTILVRPIVAPASPGTDVPIDTSVIPDGIGGAGGRRPAAMCDAPESVTIAAYDLDTGAYRWHHCGPAGFYWLEAATPEAVFVRDVNLWQSDIFVFDAATGEELDSVPVAQLESALTMDAVRPATTPPETPGLTVTGGQDDRLVVSDAATGDEIWSAREFLAYDDVWAVGDSAIFMKHRVESMLIGPLRAYELATGDIRWETAIPVESYPWWVADGRVFSIWTELTVLATDTGEVLWTTDYGTQQFPGMRGVLANDSTVFVSFANGWGSGD